MLKGSLAAVASAYCTLVLFAAAAGAMELLDSDCVKCHPGPPADIAAGGASHEDVTCSGCHEGHPPKVQDNIPRCADCHAGSRHYDKPSCARCHANVHSPLNIVMPSDTISVCRECHPKAVALIDQGATLHSEQVCGDCHEAHRHVPECTHCHEPHPGSSFDIDCKGCHDPHLPQPVIYRFDVADGDCGSCHASQFALLHTTTTKHGQRPCVSCHQRRHGVIILCADCHGLPHRLRGDATFEDCGTCHGSAHDPDPFGGKETAEEQERIPKGLEWFLQLGKEDRFVRDLP